MAKKKGDDPTEDKENEVTEDINDEDDEDSVENLLSGTKAPNHTELIPEGIARTMSYAFKFKRMLEKGKQVLSEDGTDKKRAEFRAEIENLFKELDTPETLKPSVDGNSLLLASRKLSIGLDALAVAALSLQKDADKFIEILKKEPQSETQPPAPAPNENKLK